MFISFKADNNKTLMTIMDAIRWRLTTARLCCELLAAMAPSNCSLERLMALGLLLIEAAMAAHEHGRWGNGCRQYPLLSSAKKKTVLALSPHFWAETHPRVWACQFFKKNLVFFVKSF